jgi:hypothetical protein
LSPPLDLDLYPLTYPYHAATARWPRSLSPHLQLMQEWREREREREGERARGGGVGRERDRR